MQYCSNGRAHYFVLGNLLQSMYIRSVLKEGYNTVNTELWMGLCK